MRIKPVDTLTPISLCHLLLDLLDVLFLNIKLSPKDGQKK